jgi:ABC-type transporter MlaC component
MSNYKGYDLFTTIEDRALRIRNQANVLANIAEDNSKGQTITPRASAIILGYYAEIDADDRHAVIETFKKTLVNRGFTING